MKSILVPTDFSPVSLNAVQYAKDVSDAFGLQLHILNVMHVPITDANAGVELMDTLMENARKLSNAKLESLKEELGIDCKLHAEFGLAADVIVELGEKLDLDYIVMGTSGESGFLSSLLGSVSLAVSRKSTVPVMAIPENASFTSFDLIVFGNDHKEKLGDNLEQFAKLKQGNTTRIDLVSVEPGDDSYSQEVIFEDSGMKEVSVWDKSIAEGIRNYLEQEEADLLVLKHHSKGFILDLFRASTTKELLMECTIPVLILN